METETRGVITKLLSGEFIGWQCRELHIRLKNDVFWDVMPRGSCKNRRFEECIASFIRVTRIGELGTTLAVTRNRRTLRRNTK
jgi:hypothetical protein